MKCPGCGKEVPEGGKFCSFCGENLEKYNEKKLEEGKKLLEENKFEEAIEIFKSISNTLPEALFYEGIALKEIGIAEDDEKRIKEALKKFEAAEKKVDMPDLWYEKAVALGLLNRHKEAKTALEVALSYEPENQKYKRLYDIVNDALKEKEEEVRPEKEKKKESTTPVVEKKAKILIPQSHAAMVIAPPGGGKKEFLVKAAINHLRKGEKIVFITTERSPDEVKKLFSKFNFNVDSIEGKDFIFIDIFSYSVKQKYDRGLPIDNPANLNAITVNIDKARQIIGSPFVVFFDSLSTLFIHTREQEIIKFFGTLISRLKSNNDSLCVTIQEDMHEKKTVIALQHMVDSVIEISKVEENRDLRRVKVSFSREIEIPDEFYINIRTGEIVYELKKKKEFKLPVYAIAGAGVLLLIGIIFGFTMMKNPEVQPQHAPEKVKANPSVEEKVITEEVMRIGDNREYIKVTVVKNKKASKKGFLVLDTPDYNISINLDRSYFMIYDKINQHPLTVYNDRVENPTDMLTGVDIGYADLDAVNKLPFSSTSLHDEDGLSYTVVTSNEDEGYLVVNTQGWDVSPTKLDKGYDVEGEVLFVVFKNKPYFFFATEFANLQKLGILREVDHRSPDEITQTFVIRGDYNAISIRGGDTQHLNRAMWLPFYKVQTLSPTRRPFHAGSAAISLMFPEHLLLGSKTDGGVIFSLPMGKFRFNTKEGANGAQVALEFVINVDRPEKAVAFSIDAVNREAFLYDIREASTREGYMESMQDICQRYQLGNCTKILNHQNWTYRRYAYAVTLVKDWYYPEENVVKEDTWSLADEALKKFYDFEGLIYNQLVSTRPLVASLVMQ